MLLQQKDCNFAVKLLWQNGLTEEWLILYTACYFISGLADM
jgi:hypothetical protein